MELALSSKHLSFLEGNEKKKKVINEFRKEKLNDDYWAEVENKGEEFDIQELIDQTLDGGKNRFSAEEKSSLKIIHNAVEKAESVIVNDDDAIQQLTKLLDTDIYAVKDKLNELLDDGKLTIQTYRDFYKLSNSYNLIKNNIYFVNSLSYQNYLNVFKDIDISEMPIMKSELPLIKLKFQKDLWQWFGENKTKYSGRELQKQLDLEAEASIGTILSNSLIIRESEELQKAFRKYGLTINIQ
jgi:ribosomal protein L19E